MELKIGFAAEDITPREKTYLLGQFYSRETEGVHSEIRVNTMAVEYGEEKCILCSCDLMCVTMRLTEAVRQQLEAVQFPVPRENIILAATHTHTAPKYEKKADSLHVAAEFLPEGKRFLFCEEEESYSTYGAYLAGQIVRSILAAWEGRTPSQIAEGFGRAVTGHCRRVVYKSEKAYMYGAVNTEGFSEIEGAADSGIELLYVYDGWGKPSGVLASVACPAQVLEAESFISSDYWGYVRECVQEALGKEFAVLGFCSAAGDLSPRDLIRRNRNQEPSMDADEGAGALGKRVADVILSALPAAVPHKGELKHICKKCSLPLRRVTEEEAEEAEREFAAYIRGKDAFDADDMFELYNPAAQMKRAEEQKKRTAVETEVHVLRIGNMAIATNSFELFLAYGNQIKARSPFAQTMLVQLVNGYLGYLPSKRAQAGGHYSAYLASGVTGYDGGEQLVSETLELLQKIF